MFLTRPSIAASAGQRPFDCHPQTSARSGQHDNRVEHDEETIRSADYLLDIGPAAGQHGGKIVASGTPAEVMNNPDSITGQYLAHKLTIAVPKKRRLGNGKALVIRGARETILKISM